MDTLAFFSDSMYVVHIEKSPRSYSFNDTSSEQTVYRFAGDKQYEMKDHLGNVRVLVSDVKSPLLASGAVYNGEADVLSYNNYYPFGMLQPQRNYNATDYRYGFNGKEKDDELKGSGNSYDFGARIYDSRLAKWMTIDPLQSMFAGWSPYNFSLNNLICLNDPDGRTPRYIVTQDALGNIYIKVQHNVIIVDKTKEQAAAAHIKGMENEVRAQFPQQTISNPDGTTTTVSVEINYVYTKNDKEANKIGKANYGQAYITATYSEGQIFTDKETGQKQANAEWIDGYIEFGTGVSAKKFAHELGHDFGLGDQYLEEESSGYALPLIEHINTMMGTADKFTEGEAKKIADAIKEKGIKDEAVDGLVDMQKDLPKVGSTVKILDSDPKKSGPRDVKVKPGRLFTKTRQAEEIK